MTSHYAPPLSAATRPDTMRRAAWRPFPSALFLAMCTVTWSCQAQHRTEGPAVSSPVPIPVPTTTTLGIESVQLPGGERMGLVGGSVLFDINEQWRWGPAVYGAATGQRGGLFVGGVEIQRRWTLTPALELAASLYAGGGGGATAPVGSGLMLRPAVTLWGQVMPSLQTGLSWSQVSFPSGDIRSQQVGLTLAWHDRFAHYPDARVGDSLVAVTPSGLGFERIGATAGQYRFDGRRIGMIGTRADRRTQPQAKASTTPWRTTVGLEAAAAATGDAAGYMEILGNASASVAPLAQWAPGWQVGVRGAVGLGGGGAVPTKGGVIGKLAATSEWRLMPGWTLGAEVGVVRSASAALQARQAGMWLGIDLEPGLDGGAPDGHAVHTEWTAGVQHHTNSARKDGSARALDTVVLKLNRYFSEQVYLSGQAHSAYAGGAGAYSIGLIGLGWAAPVAPGLRAGAEGLIGTAGGGGVQTHGGAVMQGLAWAGWTPEAQRGEWRLGLGQMRSVKPGLNNPTIELSWALPFTLSGR